MTDKEILKKMTLLQEEVRWREEKLRRLQKLENAREHVKNTLKKQNERTEISVTSKDKMIDPQLEKPLPSKEESVYLRRSNRIQNIIKDDVKVNFSKESVIFRMPSVPKKFLETQTEFNLPNSYIPPNFKNPAKVCQNDMSGFSLKNCFQVSSNSVIGVKIICGNKCSPGILAVATANELKVFLRSADETFTLISLWLCQGKEVIDTLINTYSGDLLTVCKNSKGISIRFHKIYSENSFHWNMWSTTVTSNPSAYCDVLDLVLHDTPTFLVMLQSDDKLNFYIFDTENKKELFHSLRQSMASFVIVHNLPSALIIQSVAEIYTWNHLLNRLLFRWSLPQSYTHQGTKLEYAHSEQGLLFMFHTFLGSSIKLSVMNPMTGVMNLIHCIEFPEKLSHITWLSERIAMQVFNNYVKIWDAISNTFVNEFNIDESYEVSSSNLYNDTLILGLSNGYFHAYKCEYQE